jgi:hypothetical protein
MMVTSRAQLSLARQRRYDLMITFSCIDSPSCANCILSQIVVTVQAAGILREMTSVRLPGSVVTLPAITPQDQDDVAFALAQRVDFVAASFTRTAQHVRDVRTALGGSVRVLAAIDSHESIDNFDDILAEADGVVIDRVALASELPVQKVCFAQKALLRKCNIGGKPAIVASQVLTSMMENHRPTRSEVANITSAVLDGADCIMLQGETAEGSYVNKNPESLPICLSISLSLYLSLFADVTSCCYYFSIHTITKTSLPAHQSVRARPSFFYSYHNPSPLSTCLFNEPERVLNSYEYVF